MGLKVSPSIAKRERFKARVTTALKQAQAMVLGRKPGRGRVDHDLILLADKFRTTTRLPVYEKDNDVVTKYVDRAGVMTSRANAEVLMLVAEKCRGIEPLLWLEPVMKGLLPPGIVGYDLAACMEINPSGLPLSVLYGGAGSDASNVLLVANPHRVLMVNTPTTYHFLPEAVSQWDSIPSRDPVKFSVGYTVAPEKNRWDYAVMFVRELKAMGVAREDVVSVQKVDDARAVGAKIVFKWRHPAQKKKVERTFTLIHENIAGIETWKTRPEDLIGGGIDVYFERAANEIPGEYDRFLPSIARSITSGGCMVLDNPGMSVYLPEKSLAEGIFSKPYSTEWMNWWEQFIPRTGPYGWMLEIWRKVV